MPDKRTIEELFRSLQSPDKTEALQASGILVACLVVRVGGIVVNQELLNQIIEDGAMLDLELLRGGALAVTFNKR